MSKVFEYFKLIGSLKTVDRTGWVRCKVKNPESVAEHMYRMAMMSFALPNNTDLDRDKCMKIALVHDMAESVVGDITPWCGVSKEDKREMEEKATARICDLVGKDAGSEMYGLWVEYETQSSPEAKFVKDLDKFEMLLQAYEYEQREGTPGSLQSFYDHTKAKYSFSTDLVKSWCDDLVKQRAVAVEKSSVPTLDTDLLKEVKVKVPITANIAQEKVKDTVRVPEELGNR